MIFETGNRCGHRPDVPRLDPVVAYSDRLPLVLEDVMREVDRLYWRRHAAEYSDLGDARRSEICEAIVCVLKALLARMDLVTKRVGRPRGDGFLMGVTAERLAEITGINLDRVNRALGELVACGWLHSAQFSELKADGTYRGYPAIRTFNARFFRALRCNIRIDRASKKAFDERRDADRARRGAEPRRNPRATRSIRRMARKMAPAREQLGAGAAGEERNRRLAELMLRVRAKHPDWPPDQQRAAALQLLDRLGVD